MREGGEGDQDDPKERERSAQQTETDEKLFGVPRYVKFLAKESTILCHSEIVEREKPH